MSSYPKWLYHPEKAACIVADEAARKALGDGWAESPAALAEAKPVAVVGPMETEKKPAKKGK